MRQARAPDAVMSQRETVIGRVDDDGVFSQPVFVERRHDSPDRVIDQRCLGEIVAKARGLVRQQQRAGETFMRRAAASTTRCV